MNNKKIKLIYSFFMFVVAFFLVAIRKLLGRNLKNAWLIAEQKHMARDNGIAFYEYCMSNKDIEKEVFYVIDYKAEDYEAIKYKSNVIRYYSLRHFIYYIEVEVLIMCFPDSACPSQLLERLFRKIKILNNRKVYLKHGIIKDDLPSVHADSFTVDMISVAAIREKIFIDKKFGYGRSITKLVGLTRYDKLKDKSKRKKTIILIMPTWRKYIEKNFTESDYYKKYQSLLKAVSNYYSFDKNTIIYFYLHNNFQKYSHYFSADENVKILKNTECKVGELLCSSRVLITDYSSVAFDFAYMKKPILYYQFDQKIVRKKHYAEGYYNYARDGFGPVCMDEVEIMKGLESLSANNYCVPKKYALRSDDFYAFRDRNNCKRTYDAIMGILRGKNNA